MPESPSSKTYDASVLFGELLGRLSGEPIWRRRYDAAPCPFENDWRLWLTNLFPASVRADFGPHHIAFWEWVWAIEKDRRPPPFVAIWPRGGAKSSSAELACVAIGARQRRRYGLYISETQELADKHVANIGGLLESESIERFYPALGARDVSKYGSSKGWSRNRLRTAAGFTIDAVGLDTGVRGIKIEEQRPDFMVVDDVDSVHDSQASTRKKITTLTQSILPAGSIDLAVLAVQNLIHPESIFSRLAGLSEEAADFLADRIVSGPFPAIIDLDTENRDGRTVITSGAPLWQGQDLQACQDAIDTYGETAFRRESQHEVDNVAGGMFDHISFRHCNHDEVPDLLRSVVWVDPAVTDTDNSDAHGIQADGIAPDGTVYRLWSWERRGTPEDTLTRAICKAIDIGAGHVGVETDQGGDTWRVVYRSLIKQLLAEGLELDGATHHLPARTRPPEFKSEKAGAGHGPKAHRASQMLVDYERNRIVHVRGTHQVLEKALRRFPKVKPFDLVDAAYWSWHDLTGRGKTPKSGPVNLKQTSKWRS